jgi:hypothetical protein
MKLSRTTQCSKCPWKVSTNPFDIPDGYCPIKHENLKNTIADQDIMKQLVQPATNAMACHHSTGNDGMYCIGWLHNQLGEGNNIALRIKMRSCENIRDLKVIGEQHRSFDETLPKLVD